MAKDYIVRVNFYGFIGCDAEYEVWAENEDDAIEQARELAIDDLYFEIDDEDEEGEEEDE